MNENKANQILGNIQQLTEQIAPRTETATYFAQNDCSVTIAEANVERAKRARDKAIRAALNPLLADIRSGMATSETADNIERLVKEIL